MKTRGFSAIVFETSCFPSLLVIRPWKRGSYPGIANSSKGLRFVCLSPSKSSYIFPWKNEPTSETRNPAPPRAKRGPARSAPRPEPNNQAKGAVVAGVVLFGLGKLVVGSWPLRGTSGTWFNSFPLQVKSCTPIDEYLLGNHIYE